MWPDSVPYPPFGSFGITPNTALQQAQQAAQYMSSSSINARICELGSTYNNDTYLIKDKCLTLK